MEFIGMEYADFNVHIVKGDEILTVECVADIGGYTISRVMMEDPNLESDVIAYTGPEFATLDEELQVSSVSSITLCPGQGAQPLHADDQLIPVPKPHQPFGIP